jgi:hypothetical protein
MELFARFENPPCDATLACVGLDLILVHVPWGKSLSIQSNTRPLDSIGVFSTQAR